LDNYHPERYLATVYPACQPAQEIIVYCNGGNCEDSKQAAVLLSDAGLPKEKLAVYVGGITEWEANHLPVETGQRQSGALKQRK